MTYTVSSGTLNSSIPYHTITGYNGACAKVDVVFTAWWRYASARSLLSSGVRLSITFVHCIQTAEDIVKRLSLPDSPIILVFWHQAPILNSKENPFGWGAKYTASHQSNRVLCPVLSFFMFRHISQFRAMFYVHRSPHSRIGIAKCCNSKVTKS